MATVVITFFLLTRFCVYKMDAEFLYKRRSGEISRREKRWSMNSQRLEEIVAELMKPIGDVRRSFDTDLSALLEEYLTEAGLHALEASEGEEEGGGGREHGEHSPPPNFAELALLLQHSASVYGRKVDFLYQHVLSVSDSLHNTAQEVERADDPEEAGAEGGGRKRRRASTTSGFECLELSSCAGAAREWGAARPPPTLPRVYIELEPRQMADGDRPLSDYAGEPIGLLGDFHVAWRLQEGMLVDELEGWDGGGARSLRPIPLMELQAAIEAAAPPALPPPPDFLPPAPLTTPLNSPPASPLPLCASTPLQLELPVKKERKRKNEAKIDDLVGGTFKILISKKVRRKLQKLQEFSVKESWLSSVVEQRARHILKHRHKHRDLCTDFRGFESLEIDIGGFLGWSSTEAQAAYAKATATASAATEVVASAGADADSDDDGFFEQSSLGDSDASRTDDHIPASANTTMNDSALWAAWQAEVVSRAEAGAARGLDIRALGARVLNSLPQETAEGASSNTPAPCANVLATASDTHEVAGLFLATLFLANAGNVEILQGPPLSVNSFSVRFVSDDPRLYCAAAAADALAPPAPPAAPGPATPRPPAKSRKR